MSKEHTQMKSTLFRWKQYPDWGNKWSYQVWAFSNEENRWKWYHLRWGNQ